MILHVRGFFAAGQFTVKKKKMLVSVRLCQIRLGSVFFHFLLRTVLTAKNPRAKLRYSNQTTTKCKCILTLVRCWIHNEIYSASLTTISTLQKLQSSIVNLSISIKGPLKLLTIVSRGSRGGPIISRRVSLSDS